MQKENNLNGLITTENYTDEYNEKKNYINVDNGDFQNFVFQLFISEFKQLRKIIIRLLMKREYGQRKYILKIYLWN